LHRIWSLQSAIREELRRAGATPPERLVALSDRRRKRLELYYADKISAEGFAEEEGRITREIESAPEAAGEDRQQLSQRDELLARFEQVAAMLQDLDLAKAWDEATDTERRVLVEELVDRSIKRGDFPLPIVTINGRMRVPRKAIETLITGH
jgi:hypothetical protein